MKKFQSTSFGVHILTQQIEAQQIVRDVNWAGVECPVAVARHKINLESFLKIVHNIFKDQLGFFCCFWYKQNTSAVVKTATKPITTHKLRYNLC